MQCHSPICTPEIPWEDATPCTSNIYRETLFRVFTHHLCLRFSPPVFLLVMFFSSQEQSSGRSLKLRFYFWWIQKTETTFQSFEDTKIPKQNSWKTDRLQVSSSSTAGVWPRTKAAVLEALERPPDIPFCGRPCLRKESHGRNKMDGFFWRTKYHRSLRPSPLKPIPPQNSNLHVWVVIHNVLFKP